MLALQQRSQVLTLLDRSLAYGQKWSRPGDTRASASIRRPAGTCFAAAWMPRRISRISLLADPEQLSRASFPVGDLSKDTVRDSRAVGLTVAEKPDSQEICFVLMAITQRSSRRKAGDRERRIEEC